MTEPFAGGQRLLHKCQLHNFCWDSFFFLLYCEERFRIDCFVTAFHRKTKVDLAKNTISA